LLETTTNNINIGLSNKLSYWNAAADQNILYNKTDNEGY